jgi:uncharacterized protein YxjI
MSSSAFFPAAARSTATTGVWPWPTWPWLAGGPRRRSWPASVARQKEPDFQEKGGGVRDPRSLGAAIRPSGWRDSRIKASTIFDVASIAPDPTSVLGELESADRLLIQQVFKPIANEYRISVPASGSTDESRPLLHVKQKKMKIREDIRFRVSPDDSKHLFMIKSKSVFEFRGRHEVLDAEGAVIGMLEKDFSRSLLRSHWHVRDATGTELLEAHETSWMVALLRRFADLGPDVFSVLTWLPFNFVLLRGNEQVGTYKRVLGKFRDRYLIELRPEIGDIDRRLIAAFAVGLDALQDR